MNKLISFLFIINGLILSLGFGLSTTPLFDVRSIFIIYLLLTIILFILLISNEPINLKRFKAISILVFFIVLALFNTFLRLQFNPNAGWPSLTCFLFFSLLFIFPKSFNENSANVIKVIIIGLFLQSIYLLMIVDSNIFGINELGQNIYENQIRENRRMGLEENSFNKNYFAKYLFFPFFYLALLRIQKEKLDFFNILLFTFAGMTSFLLASVKLIFVAYISLFIYSFYRYHITSLFIIAFIFIINFLFFDYSMQYDMIVKKFSDFLNDYDGSRLNLILDGLELSTHNFLGSGLGYSRLQLSTYTHNTIVETLISIGPFFGILFFVYIFIVIKNYHQALHNKILFTNVIFLSLFQSIYFDFFFLPVILCFIALYLKDE